MAKGRVTVFGGSGFLGRQIAELDLLGFERLGVLAQAQVFRRVGPGNFTPSPSQNRT